LQTGERGRCRPALPVERIWLNCAEFVEVPNPFGRQCYDVSRDLADRKADNTNAPQ
jgi:hypothetical protein